MHPAPGWPRPPPRAPLLPSGPRRAFPRVDSGASQTRTKNPGHQTHCPPQAPVGRSPGLGLSQLRPAFPEQEPRTRVFAFALSPQLPYGALWPVLPGAHTSLISGAPVEGVLSNHFTPANPGCSGERGRPPPTPGVAGGRWQAAGRTLTGRRRSCGPAACSAPCTASAGPSWSSTPWGRFPFPGLPTPPAFSTAWRTLRCRCPGF